MTDPPPSAATPQAADARRGMDTEPGSVPRYIAAIAVMGLGAIVWAIVWETVYIRCHKLDIAWLNLLVGFGMGLAIRKIWGIGGAVAALNAAILMLFSLGLSHLVLFEHYALNQQAADDIGIAPSFRTVMGRLGTLHWIWCATAAVGVFCIPLRRP